VPTKNEQIRIDVLKFLIADEKTRTGDYTVLPDSITEPHGAAYCAEVCEELRLDGLITTLPNRTEFLRSVTLKGREELERLQRSYIKKVWLELKSDSVSRVAKGVWVLLGAVAMYLINLLLC
jgi:hypothetical protein